MHAKTMFDRGAQCLSRGRVADLALEACPLALQLDALRVERGKPLRFANPNRAPPYDRERDEYERAECQGHEGPPPKSYAAFRHARSLALREREFTAVSAELAASARLVSTSPRDLPRQVQWSCFGGQMQD